MNTMTDCFFCRKLARKTYVYYTLDICQECYLQLKINKLEKTVLPEDTYLRSFVGNKERIYVDALAHFATLFPKALSGDLLGFINVSSYKNEELDPLFTNSMIIAARSVLLFGAGTQMNANAFGIHALHALGNLVGISIMGNLAESYKNKSTEEEAAIAAIRTDIDRIMVDILNEIDKKDDGSLHDIITDTMDIIKTGEDL